MISGSLYIKGGALWEDLPGVVSVMGSQMRQGGAGNLSADELDRRLEVLAAGVGSSFGDEFGEVTFSSLSSDFNEVFNIFTDILLRPRFEESRLELWRGQALERIKRRKDSPGTVASIAFQQLLFGNTPYGRVLIDKDIENINIAAIKEAYNKFVNPEGAILAISGDMEVDDLKKLIQEKLGGWQKRENKLTPPEIDFHLKQEFILLNYLLHSLLYLWDNDQYHAKQTSM